jgi:hypothetical protein
MSANPLRTLLLVVVVVGFGTVVLGTGRFDSFVTRAATDFIASSAAVSDGEPSTARSPYGIWSFEFE